MSSLDIETAAQQLIDWLNIDSTSGEEEAFLLVLEEVLSAAGFTCTRQEVAPRRWNLLAQTATPPRLLYSTHVDTVPPFLPVRRSGDVIYGRGACDTKGGIVAMIHAGLTLLQAGHQDLGYLFVVGEEVDHIGARFAQDLETQAERIILCEPTCNQVVRAQKGMLRLELSSKGTAGHSAYLERGVSALDPLLDVIEAIRRTAWPTDDVLGPTTLNIGILEGGVAANVFAPQARAELLFRAVSPVEPLLDEVTNLVSKYGDSRVSITSAVYNDPVFFEPPEGVETCVVPFNTDATYLVKLAPVWLVGPGDIKDAHADDEHITLESLAAGIALYTRLGREVLEG